MPKTEAVAVGTGGIDPLRKAAYRALAGLIKAIPTVIGRANSETLMASVLQDFSPIVTTATKHGEIKFYCPARLPLYRARTLLSKEPETIRWIDSFAAGDTLWDIGANVGAYTLYAANRGIFVRAFEPSAANFQVLTRNIELNGLGDRVSAYCMAIHDKTGLDYFNMASTETGSALNSFANSVDWEGNDYIPTFRQAMLGFRADDFIEQFAVDTPTHIKIDVDGNEDRIVEGAREALSSERVQSVLVELDERRSKYCEGIFAILKSAGLLKITREDRPEGGDGKFAHVYNFTARRV